MTKKMNRTSEREPRIQLDTTKLTGSTLYDALSIYMDAAPCQAHDATKCGDYDCPICIDTLCEY